ncbi:ANTAR domain-containing protein, partial [Streptomyces caniscabiei]
MSNPHQPAAPPPADAAPDEPPSAAAPDSPSADVPSTTDAPATTDAPPLTGDPHGADGPPAAGHQLPADHQLSADHQRAADDPAAVDVTALGAREQSSPVGRLAATVERLRREVQAAQAEADGRAVIELAKGILVERLGCGPAQAALQLAELTEQAGVTPLEFAVEVINQAARDRLSEMTTALLATTAGRDDADEAPDSGSLAVRLRTAESAALAAHDAQAVADSLLEHA